MMNRVDYPVYCDICNKGPFAGNIPAEQHFRSPAHASKEAQRNTDKQIETGNAPNDTQTYVSQCNACGKKFNNSLSADQHFASENHRKRAALLSSQHTPVSLGSSDIECDSPDFPCENLVDIQPRQSAFTGTSLSSPNSKNLQEYIFNDVTRKGFCNVCNIDLTSHEHAKQHLSGQKHIKAKQHFGKDVQGKENNNPKSGPEQETEENLLEEYYFDGVRGFCNVCKIELTSHQHASQHINGKPHAKAKVALSSSSNKIHTTSPQLSPDSKGAKSQIQEYTFSGGKGFCLICQLDLTSKAHAEQHLSGKNHEKAKAKVIGAIPKSLPLNCEICQKTFSGPECAMQHFNSAKHFQKEALLKDHNSSSPVGNLNVPVTATTNIDKTQWLICEVCNVRLNSPEQLSTHKSSPKHKAEEQKHARSKTNVEVRRNIDYKMGVIEPKVHVQNTGVYSPKKTGYFESQGLKDDGQSFPSSFGTLSFLSNQPGMFAQDLGPEGLTMGTFNTLDPESILNDKPPDFNGDFDDTSPKIPIFESQDHSYPKHEEKNLKDTYVPEKDMEKRLINEKINSTLSVKKDPYLDMPHLEKMNGSKSTTSIGQKSLKDMANLSKQNLNVNEPRPPGAYPYESKAGKDTQIESSASLTRNETLKHVSVGGDKTKTQSPSTSSDGCVQGITPPKVQNTSRSSGSVLINRVTTGTSKSRGGARDGGSQIPLYNSSDESDESDQEADNEFYPCTSADVSKRLRELGINSLKPNPSGSIVTDGMPKDRVVNPYRATHKYYCEICQCPMNSKKALKDHYEGRKHMQKVAVMVAEPRTHQSIVKEVTAQDSIDHKLTAWEPRSYQWELYRRAMEGDRVIFLPTGTGKTLISCMAISAMLELNPTRQALFLVDKVLLVIQQSRYLVKQIGDRDYERFDLENPSQLIRRKLKIAALCGGQQATDGVPIWQHDLIVVTAAYCEQLLMRNVLKWDDLCIVVFDEAHHCTKSHPFNKLLEKNHLTRPDPERPKILGLTASPAGKKTFAITVTMLQNLMTSMGGAKIGVTREHQTELKRFQSSAKLIVSYQPMNFDEQKIQEEMQKYLLGCYLRLSAETNISEKMDDNMIPNNAEDLHGDVLNCLEVTLNNTEPNDTSAAKKIEHRNLVKHTSFICMALNTLFEAGVDTAVEELNELMDHDSNLNFAFAKSICLNPDNLLSEIEKIKQKERDYLQRPSNNTDSHHSSKIDALVQALLSSNYIDWEQENPMSLVLVKERSTAIKISKILQEHGDIMKMGLKVTYLIGHGGGSGGGDGMAVQKQRKILHEIKHHKYQIVVATSVAEEGIDIPECELVITMNLPSSVTALVQMRGRARKENSKFVIFCNDKIEEDKLNELLGREDNMIKAANYLFEVQNKPEPHANFAQSMN